MRNELVKSQEILGHIQISMTMDVYSHVLPVMHREAINRLSTAFAKQQEDQPKERGSDGAIESEGG